MPSRDVQWLIGVVVAAAVAISVQTGVQFAGLRSEIAGLRGGIGELRTDLRRLDDRLRAVEIALGKVEQRLETLERLNLPTPAD